MRYFLEGLGIGIAVIAIVVVTWVICGIPYDNEMHTDFKTEVGHD